MTSEAAIQNRVRLTLGQEPDIVLWRLSQGMGRTPDGRMFRGGIVPGAADLVGVGGGGRFIAIEIKNARGRLAREQAQWLRLVQAREGFACVIKAKTLEQAETRARAALALMRAGVTDWAGWPYVEEDP